jgi:hypothetical protein
MKLIQHAEVVSGMALHASGVAQRNRLFLVSQHQLQHQLQELMRLGQRPEVNL